MKKISILIVDDNSDFIGRMITLLDGVDNIRDIHTAGNYEEAFLLFDKNPDLVFLDIRLPDQSGMKVLKGIKESARDCEVIMLSNYTSEYYRQQCKQLGALCFLDKTNDFELVPGMVKKFSDEAGNRK